MQVRARVPYTPSHWSHGRAVALKKAKLLTRQRGQLCLQISFPSLILLCIAISRLTVSQGSDIIKAECKKNKGNLPEPVSLTPYGRCRTADPNWCTWAENLAFINGTDHPLQDIGTNIPRLPSVNAGTDSIHDLYPHIEWFSMLSQPLTKAQDVLIHKKNYGQFLTGIVKVERLSKRRYSYELARPDLTSGTRGYDALSDYEYFRGKDTAEGFAALISDLNLAVLAPFNATIAAYTNTPPELNPKCTKGGSRLTVDDLLFVFMAPFAMSFTLPVFLSSLVREKESKLLQLMRMSGLSSSVFWGVTFLFDYGVFLSIMSVFLLILLNTGLDVVVFNGSGTWVVFILVWGAALTSFSYALASLFSKASSASSVGYTLTFFSVGAALAYESFGLPGSGIATVLNVVPTFAFTRGIVLLSSASNGGAPIVLSQLSAGDPFSITLISLSLDFVLYLSIAVYSGFLLSSDNGRDCCNWRSAVTSIAAFLIQTSATVTEASDCAAERERAQRIPEQGEPGIVVRNLTKVFPSGSVMVLDNFCLTVGANECLALLGPNGAGKSTLISILTGVFSPTLGDAYVCGNSVSTAIGRAYPQMGVVPQFDILWDNLSALDHVLFFARIKGVPKREEVTHAQGLLSEVGLGNAEAKLAKHLTPGERRCLSIACALVGAPAVVILDEPTTGIDPEAMAAVWSVLLRVRMGRTILLATHQMDEAKALSTRIAIMSQGKLRCIGPHRELALRYGADYRVRIWARPASVINPLRMLIEELVPYLRVDGHMDVGQLVYTAPRDKLDVALLFETLEKARQEYEGVGEWELRGTSIEEVFAMIVRDDEIALNNTEQ